MIHPRLSTSEPHLFLLHTEKSAKCKMNNDVRLCWGFFFLQNSKLGLYISDTQMCINLSSGVLCRSEGVGNRASQRAVGGSSRSSCPPRGRLPGPVAVGREGMRRGERVWERGRKRARGREKEREGGAGKGATAHPKVGWDRKEKRRRDGSTGVYYARNSELY